jgi:hypothetical protein
MPIKRQWADAPEGALYEAFMLSHAEVIICKKKRSSQT